MEIAIFLMGLLIGSCSNSAECKPAPVFTVSGAPLTQRYADTAHRPYPQ